jgi:glycosyltransferase involved in cell wall biosynthesis
MEEKTPMLVSVITCFYNEEAFLSEAVNSVLNQEYTHWELLLVDDGSTDESVQIAKQFAADFPEKIFYVDHPAHQNKGLSSSRKYLASNRKPIWSVKPPGIGIAGMIRQLIILLFQ